MRGGGVADVKLDWLMALSRRLIGCTALLSSERFRESFVTLWISLMICSGT